MRIVPCVECLSGERALGWNAGQEEGYDEGHETGKGEGYEKGKNEFFEEHRLREPNE
jgi:flagellar biosynthesis/type III secretory pathway protein FliH